MTKFLDQLNKTKQEIILPSDRKAAIRTSLIQAMHETPVREHSRFAFFSFHFSRTVLMPLVLFAIAFGGAGVAYAAQGSLPGDALYGFKIHVNEKVKTGIVLSSEQKAEAQLDIYENRLYEAVKLSTDSQLTEDKSEYLKTLFEQYEAAAQARIDKLNNDGKEEAAEILEARLEAIIATHERILSKMKDEHSGKLYTVLKQKTEADNTEQEQNQDADQFKAAAENKINAAAKVLEQAEIYIQRKESELEENSKSDAVQKLKTADATLQQARKQLEDGKYQDAFNLANKAIRQSQQAKTQLRLHSEFQIRIDVNDDGEVRGAKDDQITPPSRGQENSQSQDKKLFNLPIRWQN